MLDDEKSTLKLRCTIAKLSTFLQTYLQCICTWVCLCKHFGNYFTIFQERHGKLKYVPFEDYHQWSHNLPQDVFGYTVVVVSLQIIRTFFSSVFFLSSFKGKSKGLLLLARKRIALFLSSLQLPMIICKETKCCNTLVIRSDHLCTSLFDQENFLGKLL